MTETKRRLFVAIPVPEEILQALEDAQQNFKRYARDAKWVKRQSIHLTLRFLGYVEPSKIPAIEKSLFEVSENIPTHTITVQSCGFFPNTRRPSVFWAGVNSENLISTQLQVEEAMNKLGFEKEDRAFNAHLTLARFRDSHGLMQLVEEAKKFQDKIFGEFQAHSFQLFESILHREGAEYIELANCPFRK